MRGFGHGHRRSPPPRRSNPSMLVSTAGLGRLEEQAPGSLVHRCVVGDVTAWRALHRRYQPVAAAFLRKLGLQGSDVDDACQEVFLQMFRNLHQYRGEAELQTWMYRICASQASRQHRRARGLGRLLELLRLASHAAASGVREESSLDSRRALEHAMGRMSPGERLVFVLFELEGLPGANVAEIANCPLNTVWRRLHDARRKLRESLATEPLGAAE